MSDIVLRPRSATELVDAAFQVYRRAPVQFVVALALIYVPWLVLLTLLRVDLMGESAVSNWAALVLAPVSLVIYSLASGVTIELTNDVYFGRHGDVTSAFRIAGRRLGSLIVATLALGVIVILAIVVAVLVSLALPALWRPFIGALAGIAASIYVWLRFFATSQAVIIEKTDASRALARSSKLSQGQKGHVFGTLLLAAIIFFVVFVGVALIAQIIPSRVVQSVISTVGTVIVLPIFVITQTLLYYDTRIRNEGFDVEYLASSVPAPEPEQAPS